MTATNHATTGVLMVVVIKQPALGLIAAFLSHFVLDVIPHWNHKFINHSLTQLSVIVDFFLAGVLVIIFCQTLNISTSLIITAGVLGALPDAMWLTEFWNPKISREIGANLWSKICWFFHWIQWSETSQGFFVELSWLLLTLVAIYQLK